MARKEPTDYAILLDNPIRRIRQSLGLDRRQFASLLEVSYTWLSYVENGRTTNLGPSVLWGLARLGYDPDVAQRDYREWRERMLEAIRARASALRA